MPRMVTVEYIELKLGFFCGGKKHRAFVCLDNELPILICWFKWRFGK